MPPCRIHDATSLGLHWEMIIYDFSLYIFGRLSRACAQTPAKGQGIMDEICGFREQEQELVVDWHAFHGYKA